MPFIQENRTSAYSLEGKRFKKAHPRYSITIPKSIMAFLGWKKGDELEFKLANGKVILKRKEA